jgi:hypothetical protein
VSLNRYQDPAEDKTHSSSSATSKPHSTSKADKSSAKSPKKQGGDALESLVSDERPVRIWGIFCHVGAIRFTLKHFLIAFSPLLAPRSWEIFSE